MYRRFAKIILVTTRKSRAKAEIRRFTQILVGVLPNISEAEPILTHTHTIMADSVIDNPTGKPVKKTDRRN